MNKMTLPDADDDAPEMPSGRAEAESARASIAEPPPSPPPIPSTGLLAAGWKILQSPLANLIGPLVTLIFALVAIAIIRETLRDVVVIRPIGVPQALTDEGYSSSIVSQRLLDQIALIKRQNEIVSRPFLKKAKSFDTELGAVDMQLPGLGMSLRSALSYLRTTFGAGETEVGGEIIQQADNRLVLRLRVSSQRGPFFDIVSQGTANDAEGGASSLDDILRSGAIQTVHALDSYALAVYYLGKQQAKVPETVQYCEDYDSSCKPWSALLRGLVFSAKQDWTAAAENYQAALDDFRFPANAWPAY